MANLNQVHKILEAGFAGLPQPRDTEKCVTISAQAIWEGFTNFLYLFIYPRPKYYVPRNPYTTPAYYPQSPLPSFDSPALYARLDPETLFYIFYFHAGTYQQYVSFGSDSLKLDPLISEQVSCRERAQTSIVALPHQVSDVVPTPLGTASYHRRVRTGCLRVL